MRILTWNINSIKAAKQHPYWSKCRSYKELLDRLDSSIICLQEFKVSRDKIDSELALVEGYDAYFSFCKAKKGYVDGCDQHFSIPF
jgi:AP endonuclease-2